MQVKQERPATAVDSPDGARFDRPGDVLVAFGITGDLAKQMTLRSLYRLDRETLIYGPGDRLLPICHQYDRFPDLREAVEARFANR